MFLDQDSHVKAFTVLMSLLQTVVAASSIFTACEPDVCEQDISVNELLALTHMTFLGSVLLYKSDFRYTDSGDTHTVACVCEWNNLAYRKDITHFII